MKLQLVRIGNSRGIRIPKPILEQCGLKDAVDLRVEEDHLVIARTHYPRQGWEEAFRAAGSSTGDQLLLENVGANEFDQKEWCW
jgi:antitoxin MazE